MASETELTTYLNKNNLNDADWEKVWRIVYGQLKHLARLVKSSNRTSETLNTTALVHDVFLKFKGQDQLNIQGKKHFYRLAAQAMRHILIDAARAKLANKRNAPVVEWEDDFTVSLMEQPGTSASELIAIDDALEELKSTDTSLVQLVELHFFTGYNFAEIAAIQGVSESTIYRDWKKARAWLYAYMNQ